MAATPSVLVELPDELPGARVLLRPYREDDARDLWEAVEESRGGPLGAWMPWVKEYQAPEDALATVRRMRAKWLLREELVTAIFERDTGRFVGGSGLVRIDWTIRRFEIGYWLRTSAIGHGYVTETVQLLTGLAFDRLEANRVEIRMDVRNTRSRAVPVRLGFVFEGCMRRAMPDIHAQPGDIDVFALIRDDYERLSWRAPI